ncbi:hypothetical protein V7S43_015361 [Phytophthora oleae]|uniref:Crinkler effector protein N-terminal domain-containing protein n=1 Tax=Phytophthora oleae TaxID=2107226 RepID=A0ABD3EZS4_9STRA
MNLFCAITEKWITIQCDAKDLQLFLAKKGDTWLDWAGVTVDKTGAAPVMLDGPEKYFVEMVPTLWLKNDKHFGANFQPDEGQVHVLVVAPEMPPRKKQKVSDDELTNTMIYFPFQQEELVAIYPKSSFGCKSVQRLVHPTGVLGRLRDSECLGIEKVYYFTWNAANNCYEASLSPISGNRYEGLFDGNESGAVWARAQIFVHSYLFASPRTDNYNEFVKEDCAKIYMNPWTKDECQGYVDAVELEDEGEWFNRYNLVGGKPRLLFSVCLTWEYLIAEVKNAIPTEFDQLQDMVSGWGEEMKHILFEMHRDVENPGRCFFQFASDHIANKVTDSLKAQSKDRIHALLQS